MKKTLIAALASLMLAATISGVSGTATNTTTGVTAIFADGSAPIPLIEASTNDLGDAIPHAK